MNPTRTCLYTESSWGNLFEEHEDASTPGLQEVPTPPTTTVDPNVFLWSPTPSVASFSSVLYVSNRAKARFGRPHAFALTMSPLQGFRGDERGNPERCTSS